MSHKQKQDLRTIYDLLDKLCRKFSGDRHKEILKSITTTIADSQQGFLSNHANDECSVVSKIKSHLATKSESNLATFTQLHDELSSLADTKFRSSILSLFLLLSDMESALPNTNMQNDSVFTLPVKNRSIEPSASMEQIYVRGFTTRVSLKSYSQRSKLIPTIVLERVDKLFKLREQSKAGELSPQTAIVYFNGQRSVWANT